MKKAISFFAIFLSFFCFGKPARAITNPLSTANNKFGIHVTAEEDFDRAVELVNSTGGDWGYVTLVIREDERNIKRWQKAFDQLRRLHLIPIVRLATVQKDNGWERFGDQQIDNWIYFLNSLNWIVKNRYIIIGNEPNNPEEWSGEVNPIQYSNVVCDFSKGLKQASSDFYILPAGLDASAPDKNGFADEATFLDKIIKDNSGYFDCLDGWTSHSYPNPNFSGSEKDRDKGSIQTYKWELDYLKKMGITKTLPVFITETGWSMENLSEEEISQKFDYAYKNVWNDNRIVTITPFLLNYQQSPFAKFSWIDKNNNPYVFFETVKNIAKTKGQPVQEDRGDILFFITPSFIGENSQINALVLLKNEGQSIWSPNDTQLRIALNQDDKTQTPISSSVEPGQTYLGRLTFSVYNPNLNYIRGDATIMNKAKPISAKHNFEIQIIKPMQSKAEIIVRFINNLWGWIIQKPKNLKNPL
jgi:hypothetical protein